MFYEVIVINYFLLYHKKTSFGIFYILCNFWRFKFVDKNTARTEQSDNIIGIVKVYGEEVQIAKMYILYICTLQIFGLK